jgi:hypothetical protein
MLFSARSTNDYPIDFLDSFFTIHRALRNRKMPNTPSLYTDLAERGHDGVGTDVSCPLIGYESESRRSPTAIHAHWMPQVSFWPKSTNGWRRSDWLIRGTQRLATS